MSQHDEWIEEVETCIKQEPGCTEDNLVEKTGLTVQVVRKILYKVCYYKGRIFWIGQALADRRFYFSG